MNIYPNPSTNILQLEFKSAIDRMSNIQILNLISRVVHFEQRSVFKGLNSFSINVSGFPEGL
ncbi:MAG: hypothetical protein ACI959_000843, partial [Limisphaerales bacterium]